MCGRSANFNSVVFLAACGLLTAGSGDEIANDEQLPVLRDDPRCSPSLSVVLSMENSGDGVAAASRTLEKNSSLPHNSTVYPAHLRWTDGNITYGCACKLRNCIRKCCRGDEVLGEKIIEKKPICQKISHNDTMPARVETPNLRLSKEQMAEEIQDIDELREHFLLLENFVCPAKFYPLNPDEYQEGKLILLNPDEFPEDKVILQANGSLIGADGTVFPLWNYCIDWQMTFDRIGILVCLTQNVTEENIDSIYTAHHVGIAVSIPFLVATFLVYAIIPELKNLYGKTLMCYVICLITAYIFLLLVNYIFMSSIRTLCFITGKQPPRIWFNSFAV